MTPLQSLKQNLQRHLEVCQESEDYKEALEDCIYGCTLSNTACVEHLIKVWLHTNYEVNIQDIDYVRGVQFVDDQWNIIKEKEDEMVTN